MISAIGILLLLVFRSSAHADDLLLLNRPVNIQGLTGLLFTTSPYSLPSGTIEIGGSVLADVSHQPDYKIIEYPVTLSFGLPHNMEMAIRCSYGDVKDSSAGTVESIHTTGDAVLSMKWNFIPPREDSAAPAWALFGSGTIPTSYPADARINSATRWAARLGIASGSEFSWRDHTLDIYADASIIGNNPSDSRHRDMYWNFNAGLLFPISKYQNLQMLLEYTEEGGRSQSSFISAGNYSAMTYGLRLVNERFNTTIGTQLVHNEVPGLGKSEKTIGLMSLKF